MTEAPTIAGRLVGQLIREHQRYKLPNAEYTAIWQHEYDALGNRTAITRLDGTRTEWLTYGSGHVHGGLFSKLSAQQSSLRLNCAWMAQKPRARRTPKARPNRAGYVRR